jgi:hypothetical protein
MVGRDRPTVPKEDQVKKTRTPLIAAVAIGLLAVSAAGVGAQGIAGADTVWTYEYRVENDEGAWQSAPVSGVEFDEREMMVAPVFSGEGAYDGLTAIVEMSGRETDADGGSDADLRGAIFSGSPPPPSGFPPVQ